jgi:hypothetical protein
LEFARLFGADFCAGLSATGGFDVEIALVAFAFCGAFFAAFLATLFATFLATFLPGFLVVFTPRFRLTRVLAATAPRRADFAFFDGFFLAPTTNSLFDLNEGFGMIKDAYRVASASSENAEKTSGFRSRL